MISIDIPGYRRLNLAHLVLDYNGTVALDGELVPGVDAALHTLAKALSVHVITADTFGRVEQRLAGLDCRLSILGTGPQDLAKLEYVKQLGCDRTVCIGNGRNDRLMLQEAALGIAVVLQEGAAAVTLGAADVVCTDILRALELLTHPLRLTATLRA